MRPPPMVHDCFPDRSRSAARWVHRCHRHGIVMLDNPAGGVRCPICKEGNDASQG